MEAKNLSWYLFMREIDMNAGKPVDSIVENTYFSPESNTLTLVLLKANEKLFERNLYMIKENLNIVESFDISNEYFAIEVEIPESAKIMAEKYKTNSLSTLTKDEKIGMVSFVFAKDKFMHGIINSIILKSPVLKFQLEIYLGRELDSEEEFLNPNWGMEDFKKSIYYMIWQQTATDKQVMDSNVK